MNKDEKKMNAMIELASNVDLKEPPQDDWYSWSNQRKMTYNLARELLLTEDMSPVEAIETAMEFHTEFYHKVLKH